MIWMLQLMVACKRSYKSWSENPGHKLKRRVSVESQCTHFLNTDYFLKYYSAHFNQNKRYGSLFKSTHNVIVVHCSSPSCVLEFLLHESLCEWMWDEASSNEQMFSFFHVHCVYCCSHQLLTHGVQQSFGQIFLLKVLWKKISLSETIVNLK